MAAQRTALALRSFALALAAMAGGCGKGPEKVQQALAEVLLTDAPSASAVCGFQVSSLANVQVTELRTQGSDTEGTGSARVSGAPTGYSERPGTASCSASVTFRYATATVHRRMVISQDGRQRRSADVVLRITNLAVAGR